jgi:hypothetical protein
MYKKEVNGKKSITSKKATINTKSILTYMASLVRRNQRGVGFIDKSVQFRQWDNVKL